jgi:hypothetical protein
MAFFDHFKKKINKFKIIQLFDTSFTFFSKIEIF